MRCKLVTRNALHFSRDAQRIEQLGWMITLKILDDKDAEMELLNDDYVSVIPEKLRWRSWAGNSEGITGDAMKEFVDGELFPGLQNLDVSDGNDLSADKAGQAWKVPVEHIAESGWNLDIKNPFVKEEEVTHSTAELLDMLSASFKKSDALIEEIKKELK